MKKLTKLFIVLVLAFIAFVAVGCKKDSSSIRENPTLSDGSDVYFTVTEDGLKYDVTKQELYTHLKHERGASSLITLVDKYLLSSVDGKNYLDLATTEEVKKFIEKEVYGTNDLTEFTDEEKQEKEDAFLSSFKNNFDCFDDNIYGETIMARYKITVAQRLYAQDKLQKEYDEHMAKYEDETNTEVTSPYYTETQYANVYNAKDEQTSSYNAIIVPFTTQKAALAAKASVGELNSKEAFINLYKVVYGYKYTDESVFALSEKDINATVLAKLEKLEDGKGTDTPFEVNDGQLFVYVYRISGDVKTKFADLADDAKEAIMAKDSDYTKELLEKDLTSTYISKAIVSLRSSKNLAIYDDVLEYTYSKAIANYGTYTENTEVKSCVASVDGKEFSVQELFDQMLGDAKYKNLVEVISNKRLVANPKYNCFLENGKLTDAKATELENKLTEEKKNFEDGTYTSYGYDPTLVTWKTFLEGTYGVSTDEEYKNVVLVEDIIKDAKTKINPLEQYTKETTGEEVSYTFAADENHKYWIKINEGMTEASANYFSVTGIHVLVSLYEDVFSYASGYTQVDPTADGNWTNEQVEGAKELLTKVSDYLVNAKGTYAKKLDKLVAAYKSAPAVEGADLSTFTYGETNINLAKYKKLGLTLIWQNLGTFANGSMVENFNQVSKNVYDYTQTVAGNPLIDLSSNHDVDYENVHYSINGEDVFANGIETKFGYHLFVETKATARVNLEDDAEKPARYIPTLDEIQKYASDQALVSKVKTAISTYYSKYQNELKGTDFFNVLQNLELKELVSDANFKAYIDNYNDYIFKNNLKNITKDFLD